MPSYCISGRTKLKTKYSSYDLQEKRGGGGRRNIHLQISELPKEEMPKFFYTLTHEEKTVILRKKHNL